MGCSNSQQVLAPMAQSTPTSIDPLITGPQFSEVERTADGHFRQGRYVQAISLYKKAIETGYRVDFEIEGLGSFDIEKYNFEWQTYKWYDQQRKTGKLIGNMFDALSVCYCKLRLKNLDQMEKGAVWYQDMLAERQTYELFMGYANILYNLNKYEAAVKTYNKVLAMRPSLTYAYVSLMLLYEFRRVEVPKANALANTIIQKEPDNMYARFILAKNQKDVDKRIKMLQETVQKYPSYYRMLNELGFSYGAKKDYKTSLFWYKRCIDLSSEFDAMGYNNAAHSIQKLQDYPQALSYYYKAMQIDHNFKVAYTNVIKVFQKLNFTDQDIMKKMKEYPKMNEFDFYFGMGMAYAAYAEKQSKYASYADNAINWYKRAQAIKPDSYGIYNSLGLAYHMKKEHDLAEQYLLKSLQINPKFKYPAYNLGLIYKKKGQIDKAITWYQKSIAQHPDYYPPYNNLANVYTEKKQYQKAIDVYRKGLELNSSHTLSYCNMAVCLLKMEMYQDAFSAFQRAKELLPSDGNGLSAGNKAFLKESIAKFDKEGDLWRKMGSIGPEQKKQLQDLIKSFEENFKMLYSGGVTIQRSDEAVLKPTIIQVVKLIHEDKFQLTNVEKIFGLIKEVFHENEQYFHIIPQIFVQFFYNSSFIQKKPVLDVQSKLYSIIKDFSAKEASLLLPAEGLSHSAPLSINYQLKHFDTPKDYKVNLFKETTYFKDYQALYCQIDRVSKSAELFLAEYKEFVDAVRKRSNGIPYGVNMKMPSRADQQFKVILRILQKMFKKELSQQRVRVIISKIDTRIKTAKGKINLITIVHEIMSLWTNEITIILKEREKAKVETTCSISDLLRGKIMFHTVGDLEKAVQACDKLCHLNGYKIIELDNRLAKPQTQDVVLKIQVGQAVCELQLAMKQDESRYHFIHSIYEIERSPLGCIFGSYLFMSKGFNYPLLANCKDIASRLKDSHEKERTVTVQAANYIVRTLEQN